MQPASLQKKRPDLNSAQVQGETQIQALQSPQLANQGVQSLGAEALAQGAQRNLAVPSLVGRGLEHPGLVGGVSAHGSGWNEMNSKVPSNPNHSGIL